MEISIKTVNNGGAAMKNGKMLLPALLFIALVFGPMVPASVAGASAPLPLPGGHWISHSVIDSPSFASAMALNTPQGQVTPMVSAGFVHTVGLKADGTVIALGNNYYGQCDVGNWTDIIQVAAGGHHTVGLKSDGSVVTVGDNSSGQCDAGNWTDIIQIAAGYSHNVALKSDGTMVAVGDNSYGQCYVGNWTNNTQITESNTHTLQLHMPNTVMTAGYNSYGQCDVGN